MTPVCIQPGKHTVRFSICQIGAFHARSGGAPTNADALAERLRDIGINSICASPYTNPIRRVADMLWTLLRHRRRYRVVVLHVYSGRAFLWALAGAVAARLLGKRLIMWLHGGNLPDYYRSHSRRVSFAFSQADLIITPSSYLEQVFASDFDVQLLRYELPISSYPHRFREQAKPRLLWLRAFNAGYNPMLAPRVIHLLKPDYPDIRLLMCGADKGDGSLQATQRLAKELGVTDNIEFPGLISKDQIGQYGLEHDIFLNTTTVDNTPVSVVEAMAMGMCVVSTNVGGIPYLVTDKHDGLLVPSNDARAMAQACRRLLTDPALTQQISRQAKITAQLFDWNIIAPQWDALLTRLHYGSP